MEGGRIWKGISGFEGKREVENEPGKIDLINQQTSDTISIVKQMVSNNQGLLNLVTRLTTAKSWSIFSGDALEGLHFKKANQVSTQLGKYTDRENLSRLYEALKGPAKEAANALMITASNADTIMSSL